MSEIQNIAVENTILNILAASESNYEYPAVQKDAMEVISSKLSDIIYTTLAQKSTASSTKRCNLLKFLNNLCNTPELHLTENHYKIYLKAYEQEFGGTENHEVEELSSTISKEINEIANDVYSGVLHFYKIKNAARKEKMKRQEFIKQFDQEKLGSSLNMPLFKNISHYETSKTLIDDLLKGTTVLDGEKNNHNSVSQCNAPQYRNKQVQFCYALINIGNDESDFKILKAILHRLSTYDTLEQFEITFLIDLWEFEDFPHLDVDKIMTEKFPFIIEKIVIHFCTAILKLEEPSEVSKYFSDLSTNPKILKLQNVCKNNYSFYCKLRSMINELYVFSFCNINICKFIDYIM